MRLEAHRRCARELMQLYALDRLRPQLQHLAKQGHRCGKTMTNTDRFFHLLELAEAGMYGCEP